MARKPSQPPIQPKECEISNMGGSPLQPEYILSFRGNRVSNFCREWEVITGLILEPGERRLIKINIETIAIHERQPPARQLQPQFYSRDEPGFLRRSAESQRRLVEESIAYQTRFLEQRRTAEREIALERIRNHPEEAFPWYDGSHIRSKPNG